MINSNDYLIELVGEQNAAYVITKFCGDLNREFRENEIDYEALLELKFMDLIENYKELHVCKS